MSFEKSFYKKSIVTYMCFLNYACKNATFHLISMEKIKRMVIYWIYWRGCVGAGVAGLGVGIKDEGKI